ncbi:MAG: methylenetetrahydrofolate reductase [Desulfobacca sp.]|nr:methylenetetrahydrofolate reductase [Desulfobacca sp.]
MSKFQNALESGKFVITVGLAPPPGVNPESLRRQVNILKDCVDALAISDNRGANLAMGALAASVLAREQGGEVICTFNCRDRNRLALAAGLLGAYALGIENILLVSGDYLSFGNIPEAMPVFDLDSVQALTMARSLENGQVQGGNDLNGAPRFFLGAVANPAAQPLQPQMIKCLKKIRAGADFLITLDGYDLNKLEAFVAHIRQQEVKLLVGVRLLGKGDVECQATNNPPGNLIPPEIMNEFQGLDETQALTRGKQRAIEMIRAIKDKGLAHGVHLRADHHVEIIPEVIAAVEL